MRSNNVITTGLIYFSYSSHALLLFILNSFYDGDIKKLAGIVLSIIGSNYILYPIIVKKIGLKKNGLILSNVGYLVLTILAILMLVSRVNLYIMAVCLMCRMVCYSFKLTILKNLIHETRNEEQVMNKEKIFTIVQQLSYSAGLITMGLIAPVIGYLSIFFVDLIFSSIVFVLMIADWINRPKCIEDTLNDDRTVTIKAILSFIRENAAILIVLLVGYFFYQQDYSINAYLMAQKVDGSEYTGMISLGTTVIGIVFTAYITQKKVSSIKRIVLSQVIMFIGINLIPLVLKLDNYMYFMPLIKGFGVTLYLSSVTAFIFTYSNASKELVHTITFFYKDFCTNLSDVLLLNSFILGGSSLFRIELIILFCFMIGSVFTLSKVKTKRILEER